ncbi:exodeoxyribonuclease VII small subunit [Nostoc sp.]|uniref:exodeoxyribonuclease VII small subunit n=1 Tax=Nostoc sp. TaxID=1180 RepID=UPI002FF9C252
MVKRKSASSSDSMEGWNYETKVIEIEGIIAGIEAGELELEEVFDQFAKAVEYLRQCESFLQQRQQQVDLLIETLSDQ